MSYKKIKDALEILSYEIHNEKTECEFGDCNLRITNKMLADKMVRLEKENKELKEHINNFQVPYTSSKRIFKGINCGHESTSVSPADFICGFVCAGGSIVNARKLVHDFIKRVDFVGKEMKIPRPLTFCPHGYEFGENWYEFDECDNCVFIKQCGETNSVL